MLIYKMFVTTKIFVMCHTQIVFCTSVMFCFFTSLLVCFRCMIYVYGFCDVMCRNDEDADDDDDDDDVSPEHKAGREKLRRQQNNARERYCGTLTEVNDASEIMA